MTSARSIYDGSPRAIQNMAVSARGWTLRRTRLSGSFHTYLSELEDWNRSHEATEAMRRSLLRETLSRARLAPAFSNVPPDPSLSDFPITSKEDIRSSQQGYRPLYDGEVVEVSTGGSTGTPLRFATTHDAIRRQWAVWWRYRRWHQIDLDTWCGQFGSRSGCPAGERTVFWRINRPGRQVLFSTQHLAPSTVGRYVAEVNRRNLPWIHGLPSTIGVLTRLMADAGLSFGPALRWITFGSENVPEGVVDLVREIHGVTPRQHYGLAEAAANISECPAGRLHIDEDFSFVELLPHEVPGTTITPEVYRIVGTAFGNPAQSFVRYDTGDLVSGLEEGCDCGRPGRTVRSLDGRAASYVELPGGRRIGPISHIFRGLDGVVQAQVAVVGPTSLEVHVVPSRSFGPHTELEIARRLQERTTLPIDVSVAPRRELVRAPNGKVNAVLTREGCSEKGAEGL